MTQGDPESNEPETVAGDAVAPLIMVADDHDDSRIIATRVLRHAGFRVVEAARGDEVLRLAREQRPAVILMDLCMPGLDGWTATEQLKADPNTAGIVVLIVTAHNHSGLLEISQKVGSVGYLTKPVGAARLTSAVERCLESAARAPRS